MTRLATLLALALLAATSARAELTETEQRIIAAVKQRSPAALELLERSVRINSGTLNPEGVREVGAIFRAELDGLGFSTRWVDMPPAMKRAGHLVATHAGKQGQRLLLLGHLDTVFEKGSKVAPWDPRGERVRGQGVSDMKGGDVVIVEALRALAAVGALDGAAISVLLTGDEERVGNPARDARAPLVELAKASDVALSFESSGRQGGRTVTNIARRSAGGWEIIVKATPGHSSRIFSDSLGYGAIYEAARILDAFRDKLREPGLTFNPGAIVGGTDVAFSDDTASGTAYGKGNVIAREAIVRGDLRYLTPEQGERARQRMREVVATSLPRTHATITFVEAYPPMPATEASTRLLETYSRASLDAGFGTVVAGDPEARGAGDVQFAAPYIPGIDGLGAFGSGAHTDDEDLELASIERGAIKAAILIYRLTH